MKTEGHRDSEERKNYYPVYLDLTESSCLVIGGGSVAYRKTKRLVRSAAKVTVIAREFIPDFEELLQHNPNLTLRQGTFQLEDLNSISLVIAATDDQILNRQIAEECHRRSILVNVVDQPELCSFILPSIIQRGPLNLTISSNAKAPFITKHLRKLLEKEFHPVWGEILEQAIRLRTFIKFNNYPIDKRKTYFQEFLNTIPTIHLTKEDLKNIRELVDRLLPEEER